MTPPAPLRVIPLSGAFGLEGDRTHGQAEPVPWCDWPLGASTPRIAATVMPYENLTP